MKRFLLVISCAFALASLVSANAPISVCKGYKEEYLTCGPTCQEHCPMPNKQTGEVETRSSGPCAEKCVSGCFCEKGYVRDIKHSAHNCIRSYLCNIDELIKQFTPTMNQLFN